MKLLLIILLLFPKDKQDHFLAGSLIGFSVSTVTINQRPIVSLAWSLGSAVVIGGSKELVYDKWMQKGTPEIKDFAYTVVGSAMGFGIVQGFKWFCNRIDRWKYRRIQPQ